MKKLILRLTIISLAALFAASCSKRLDSQSNVEHEKTLMSEEVADNNRTAHSNSGPPGQGANATEGEESELQPSPDHIIEDCHRFVWLTKAVPRDRADANCPQCPSSKEAAPVLAFRGAQIERVSCTGERCDVDVVIHANFTPSKGGTINGGLVGWIPAERREEYSRGETPPGEQVYQAVITYAREGNKWRVVEFAKR